MKLFVLIFQVSFLLLENICNKSAGNISMPAQPHTSETSKQLNMHISYFPSLDSTGNVSVRLFSYL
jgi:hypothetical protein